MIPIILGLTIKDWLIITTLSILVFCIIQIRKLKKTIAEEIKKRLVPQLGLDLDIKTMGLFLKNEGCLLSKDIRIEDLAITLEDFGFGMKFILKFEEIDSLKPNERIKLNFDIFHNEEKIKADISGKIILNLIDASFKVRVYYANIENIKFCTILAKKKDKFLLEKIEFLQ